MALCPLAEGREVQSQAPGRWAATRLAARWRLEVGEEAGEVARGRGGRSPRRGTGTFEAVEEDGVGEGGPQPRVQAAQLFPGGPQAVAGVALTGAVREGVEDSGGKSEAQEPAVPPASI